MDVSNERISKLAFNEISAELPNLTKKHLKTLRSLIDTYLDMHKVQPFDTQIDHLLPEKSL